MATDLLAPPGPIPPDKLAAALEARRQRLAGLNASPAAVGLDQKLAQLRAMRTGLAFTAGRATPETLYQPQPAEATAVQTGAPPARVQPVVRSPAAEWLGGAPADPSVLAAAERLAPEELRAGRVRALTPGAEPASIVERAVGRAAAHLPGAAGEWGARTAAMGERHGQEEAVGRKSLPFLAKLPADIANLYLELEAGARIPGPIGRTIGEGYREPIMGNLAGELEAPGLAATVGRVLRTGGREGARFATLEGVKGAVQEDPAEQVIADALAGGAGGVAWGAGAQLAREALARAVAAGLRSRLGAPGPYPRPLVTTGREVPNEPPAAPAAALPPGVPPAAPDAPTSTTPPPAPAAPVAPSPVNVEAFKDEIAAGKYTDRELKQLRAQFLANAGPTLRPPQDPVTRVVDAIDTHLQAKGVAGASPIEPAPPVGAVQGEPDAIHDAQGNVVPGTEVSRMDPRAAAERRQAAGGPPAGMPERRAHVPFVPTEPVTSEPRAVERAPSAPARSGAPTHPDVIAAGTPTPAQVVRIPTASVIADPSRFQFKALGKEGVGSELKGVRTFNPNLAGVISVWRDPATHKTYVVNGHHRLELAKRTGQPELNAQFLDAPDATTARALGALINIAEGRGTATDVAKFLRDGNVTPEELDKHGVSIKGDLAKDGVALSKLAPDLFDQVATGKVPQNWGTAIGAVLDDPVLQREALKAARGARTNLTGAEVSEVARQVQAAGTETTTQATLFGSEKRRHGLYVQKAQVVAAVKKRLATDKRLFGFIAKEGRAAQLERAGTTQIDVGAAKDIAAVSARAEEIFDRLYTRTGPLATIVSEAARRTTHGEPVAAVVTDIYPQVRAAVEREVAGTGLGVARAGGQEHPPAGGTRSLADEEADRTEKPVADSQDEAQAGLGVAEPVVQDDFFGKPKAVEAVHQGELLSPTAGTRPAALPQTKIQTPEEIARVRREGAEPAGATPGELFAQGEQSAVAKAAQQIAEAVKAALPTPAGRVEPPPSVGESPQRYDALSATDTPQQVRRREQQDRQLTFGNDSRARQAAIATAMRVGESAQYDLLDVTDPMKLDARAREAAVRRAAQPKVWVTLKGQHIDPSNPAALHGLLWQFRDPRQENMHFILLDDHNTVVHHEMHTSGVINTVQLGPGFVQDILNAGRNTGATKVIEAHNHPSGDATISDDDIHFSGTTGKALADGGLTLVGHLITDDETGTWLEHHGDSYTTRAVIAPRKGTPPDWTATQGPELLRPESVMDLVSSRALPKDRVDVLHVNVQGLAVALEPHTLASLDDLGVWLPERRAALATSGAFVVVGHSEAYRAAVAAARHLKGVVDVIHVWQVPGETHPRAVSARADGLLSGEPHDLGPRSVPPATQVAEGAARPASDVSAQPAPVDEHRLFVSEPPPTGPIGSAADDLDDVPLPEAAGLGTRGARSFSPTRLLGALRAVFNPESFGPRAKETAGTIRAGRAVGAQELARAQHDLRTLSKLVGNLDKKQSLRLWDAAEHWGEPGTRKTVDKLGIPPAMLDTFEATTEKFSAELERLGILEPTIAHYVGRYWAGPSNEVQSFLARIFGKRPLEGPKTFKKKRSHDLFADGLRAGLTPMTYNFVDSQMLKFTEMQRAIDGRRMVNEELEAGRAKKVMLGDDPPQDAGGEWTRIGDGRDPAFTIYGPRDVALGGEYVPAQTDLMQAGGAIDRVPVFGRRIMGHFYAPPQSAAVWNNALSRGLRGNPIYDALMAPGQAAAQMILGLSGFHGVVISQEAMFSELALGRLPQAAGVAVRGVAQGRRIMQEYQSRGAHPELARVLDAMIQGGFRATRQSEFWTGDRRARFKAALRDALHGPGLMRRVSGATRVPFDAVWAAIEGASFPTMGFYVPHQKAFATYVAVERALAKLPPGTAIDEVRRVMGDVVKEMDYRFGQVMYDNHFINNVAKDLAQLIFLAPGWTGGTLQLAGRGVRQAARLGRQAVGGAKGEPPIGTSSLRYWLAAFAGLAIFNGILTYLLTGEPPHDKDFLAFRDGTKDEQGNANRFRLPGYIMHDLYSWTHHPVRTLGNKLSPGLHWVYAIGSNRTYHGDEVYDPNADPATVMSQIAAYTVESNLPISVQNIAEARHRGEHGVMGVVPGLLGVSPAPREFVRSPAQNLLAEYAQHGAPSGATPEEAAQRRLRNDVVDRFHRRELDYSGVRAELRAGGLTDTQVKDALHDVLAPPLQTRFKQLTLAQARAVYDLGTPEEKRVWGPALFAKIAKAHPRNPPHAPQPPRRR